MPPQPVSMQCVCGHSCDFSGMEKHLNHPNNSNAREHHIVEAVDFARLLVEEEQGRQVDDEEDLCGGCGISAAALREHRQIRSVELMPSSENLLNSEAPTEGYVAGVNETEGLAAPDCRPPPLQHSEQPGPIEDAAVTTTVPVTTATDQCNVALARDASGTAPEQQQLSAAAIEHIGSQSEQPAAVGEDASSTGDEVAERLPVAAGEADEDAEMQETKERQQVEAEILQLQRECGTAETDMSDSGNVTITEAARRQCICGHFGSPAAMEQHLAHPNNQVREEHRHVEAAEFDRLLFEEEHGRQVADKQSGGACTSMFPNILPSCCG